jgi:hypothetical protein
MRGMVRDGTLRAIALAIALAATPASAGLLAQTGGHIAQAGIRLLAPLAATAAAGTVVQAIVTNAAQLARLGLPGVALGERVNVVVIDPQKKTYAIEHASKGRAHVMLDELGSLRPLSKQNPLPKGNAPPKQNQSQ